MSKCSRNTYVLIMAGGVGSRFWPKSRTNFPKQFIDILGFGKSLLQLTFERFLTICPPDNIFILSNEQYHHIIEDQVKGIPPENILLEPCRNNTAPCIAYACYKILKKDSEANIVVTPSDHLILKEQVFIDKLKVALNFTYHNEALLTLGISPTRPDTGYGYIKITNRGSDEIFKVKSFMEKPDLKLAKEYVASGNYLWNAGIFIWRASAIRNAFKRYAPEIHALFDAGNPVYNTILEADFIKMRYPQSPSISIDYAILEKANNVYTIPVDIGWSDLGTWASLHAVSDKDEHNNTSNSASIYLSETENCIVNIPGNKTAVIKGLRDFIVVDDDGILLIYPKADEQEIKNVAAKIPILPGNIISETFT